MVVVMMVVVLHHVVVVVVGINEMTSAHGSSGTLMVVFLLLPSTYRLAEFDGIIT